MGGQAGGRWLPQKISYHEMMLLMTQDTARRPRVTAAYVPAGVGGTSTLEAFEDTSELSLPGLHYSNRSAQ